MNIPKINLEEVLTRFRNAGHSVTGDDFKYKNKGMIEKGVKLRFIGLDLSQAQYLSAEVYALLNNETGMVGTYEPTYDNSSKVLSLTYRVRSCDQLFNQEQPQKQTVAQREEQVVEKETKKSTPGCGSSLFSRY